MALNDSIDDREYNKFVLDPDGATSVRGSNNYSRYGPIVRKTITFDGSAGGGAAGTVNIFTVTGDVMATVFAVCKSDLTTSGAATIAIGTTTTTNSLIASTTATTIDNNEIWFGAVTPTAGSIALTAAGDLGAILSNGEDIIATIASANITGGSVAFYCMWTPLSSDGAVVAA